jgi:hypothetical protein
MENDIRRYFLKRFNRGFGIFEIQGEVLYPFMSPGGYIQPE